MVNAGLSAARCTHADLVGILHSCTHYAFKTATMTSFQANMAHACVVGDCYMRGCLGSQQSSRLAMMHVTLSTTKLHHVSHALMLHAIHVMMPWNHAANSCYDANMPCTHTATTHAVAFVVADHSCNHNSELELSKPMTLITPAIAT